MEVDVNKRNSNKQHKKIDMQKVNILPPHIQIKNNISCFYKISNFMKNITFTFN